MDTWNRDQLYIEVWEQPASKVAVKYSVSGVMIGKIFLTLEKGYERRQRAAAALRALFLRHWRQRLLFLGD